MLSQAERERRMKEWNSCIDEYIRAEGHLRDSFEVDYQAKIDLEGGSLYKTCSAQMCEKVEKRDVPSIMRCSGCHVVGSEFSLTSGLSNVTHTF